MSKSCVRPDNKSMRSLVRCVIDADVITARNLRALLYQVITLIFLSILIGFNSPEPFITRTVESNFSQGSCQLQTYILSVNKKIEIIDFSLQLKYEGKQPLGFNEASISASAKTSMDDLPYEDYYYQEQTNLFLATTFSSWSQSINALILNTKKIMDDSKGTKLSLLVEFNVEMKSESVSSCILQVKYRNPAYDSMIDTIGLIFSILEMAAVVLLIAKIMKIGSSKILFEHKIAILYVSIVIVSNLFVSMALINEKLSYLVDSMTIFLFIMLISCPAEQQQKFIENDGNERSLSQTPFIRIPKTYEKLIGKWVKSYFCVFIGTSIFKTGFFSVEAEKNIHDFLYVIGYILFFNISQKASEMIENSYLFIRKFTIFDYIGKMMLILQLALHYIDTYLPVAPASMLYSLKCASHFLLFSLPNILALILLSLTYPQIRQFDMNSLVNTKKPHLDFHFFIPFND